MINGFNLKPDFKRLVAMGYLQEVDLDGYTSFQIEYLGKYSKPQEVVKAFTEIFIHYDLYASDRDTLLFVCLLEQIEVLNKIGLHEEMLRYKEELRVLTKLIITCHDTPTTLTSLSLGNRGKLRTTITDKSLISWVGEALSSALCNLKPSLPIPYLEVIASSSYNLLSTEAGGAIDYGELKRFTNKKGIDGRTYQRRCVANFMYRLCTIISNEGMLPSRNGKGFSDKLLTLAGEVGDLFGWDTIPTKGTTSNYLRKQFAHYKSNATSSVK